jgi:hypothetical protein
VLRPPPLFLDSVAGATYSAAPLHFLCLQASLWEVVGRSGVTTVHVPGITMLCQSSYASFSCLFNTEWLRA